MTSLLLLNLARSASIGWAPMSRAVLVGSPQLGATWTPLLTCKAEGQVLSAVPSAGLKHVGNPRRRCKFCYIVIENERKYVFCDKYPRHKQVSKIPIGALKASMIMTHATQGSNRKIRGRMSMLSQQWFREDY